MHKVDTSTTPSKRLLPAAIGTVLIVAATAVWWVAASPGATAEPDGTQPVNHLGSTLTSHDGSAFSMAEYRGKSVVLNFIFTRCPSICPTQTSALKRVRDALPESMLERVQFVSVTIDPEHDTPEVMSAFARRLGVNVPNWTFVTGKKTDIEALHQLYSAKDLPGGAAPLDHRTEIRLLDASGRVAQTYAGSPLDEPRLAREIETVDRLFGNQDSPSE